MPRPADNDSFAESATSAPMDPFSKALLDPDLPTPEGVVGPNGKRANKRFNVYRNNVTVGLIGTVADIYPAVQRLVGEQFFDAMARVYVQTEQPKSPLLFRYGTGFPSFLETFEPVAKLAYLPDVARIERVWLDAYHAADEPALDPVDLSAIPPEDLALQRFVPHPATAIVRSPFAAVSIFSATRAGNDLTGIYPQSAEDGLVTRRGIEVEIRQLPAGGAEFLQHLIDGATLGEAAEAGAAIAQDFDLAAAIGAMLEAGAFSALDRPD
ncbi:MAG: DNA-binding domain-containing protein [Pseudomonadota bacterium]